MTDIATRAEQAAPEEARGLLEELWDARVARLDLQGRSGAQFDRTFRARLDCEAYVDAAMMLPEQAKLPTLLEEAMRAVGKDLALHIRQMKPEDNYTARLALALIAAIARSVGK